MRNVISNPKSSTAPLAVTGALLALLILGAAARSTQAANLSCPSCNNLRAMQGPGAQQSLLSNDASQAVGLGINVASLLNRGAEQAKARAVPQPAFQFQAPKSPFAEGVKGYDGSGELPGAFKRPWEMAKTDFDPSFITPFYTTQAGPINVPSAPWNLFLTPQLAARAYAVGMMQLGMDFAPELQL